MTQTSTNQVTSDQVTTVGVVLAGGQSSRMGKDKSQLQIDEQTLVQRSCQLLFDTGLNNVLVSTNLHLDDLNTVTDIYPNKGPLAGIHAALVKERKNLIIIPVDMPLLDANILNELMKKGQENISPTHSNLTRLSPTHYSDNIFPLYLPFSGEVIQYLEDCLSSDCSDKKQLSIKRFLKTFNGQQVALTRSEIHSQMFSNVNTPEEWQHTLTFLEQKNE